jgi:hypothetical protein
MTKGPDMAEDSTTAEQDTGQDTEQDTSPDAEQDTSPDAEQDTVSRDEFRKVIEQRDKIKAELRALKKPKPETPTEPTETDKLRTALARTAGVSVLVRAGITEDADQEAVLSIPGMLSDLDVSDDGMVDTDALAERLDTLRRIFTPKDTRRPVTKIRTASGGDSGPADPDAARYRKILGRG